MENIQPGNKRGVVYIFWGDKAERYAERSIRSLRVHHPGMAVHCHRVAAPAPGSELQVKSLMASITPFQSTLYLDVDTVVLGNLDFAFEQTERFGLACAINECPWMRRYGNKGDGDLIEYNTGVLLFTSGSAAVFEAWKALAPVSPAVSRWTTLDDKPRGSNYDDQASFARAMRQCNFNPYVLPFNYNFRPEFFRSAFAPIKVWHDYREPSRGIAELSAACEAGRRPVTYFVMNPTAGGVE